MKIIDRFLGKASPKSTQTSLYLDGMVSNTPRDIRAYSLEGYAQNPVIFTCANIIATAAASVHVEMHKVSDGNTDIEVRHPLLDLLAQPNPMQSWEDFVIEMVSWHRVAGEVFILRLPEKGQPRELYLLNPAHIDIDKPDVGSVPKAYKFGSGTEKKRYPVNPLTGVSQILHVKTFNPANPWRGLSPMSPAARDVDIHNNGARWNSSLLLNSAKPSGVLEVVGTVSETAIDQLRKYFKAAWQGVTAAGDVPLLTGGAKFTPVSHNPKDMDFQNSMAAAAKNMGLVYGVPLPLLTMDAATFSNMAAAEERLWTDTVMPLLDLLLKKVGGFLLPLYGDKGANRGLAYNADSIPALEGKRERLFKRMGEAVGKGLLTPNEARVEMGFDEVEGGEELLVPSSLKPLGSEEEAAKTELVKAMKASGYTAREVAEALGELKAA